MRGSAVGIGGDRYGGERGCSDRLLCFYGVGDLGMYSLWVVIVEGVIEGIVCEYYEGGYRGCYLLFVVGEGVVVCRGSLVRREVEGRGKGEVKFLYFGVMGR